MKQIKQFLLVVALLTIFANMGWGQVINEDFTTGTVGNSVTSAPISWGTNGTGSGTHLVANSTPLSYSGYNFSGGNYVSVTKSPLGTVNVGKIITGVSTGTNTFYYSFLMKVNTVSTASVYFAALTTILSTTYNARLWMQSATGGYNLGISKSGNTVTYNTSSVLATGTTYLILVKYVYSTGTILDDQMYLWINPTLSTEPLTSSASITDNTTTDATTFSNSSFGFTLRTNTTTPNYGIDGIKVSYASTSTSAWTTLGAASATINVGSITDFGNQVVNTTSSEKTFNVSGSNLTANISIVPPSGFEISTGTGGSFVATNPITLTQTSGTVASTPIYVRFAPTAVQSYSGNITHTSGAVTQNVAVSGTGTIAAQPTTQTSAINFSNVTQNTFDIAWTSGNGTNRAVFMKEGSGGITNPSNGTAYTASNNWSSKGTQLGSSGYYCIYNGNSSTVSMTGLSAGLIYYVQAFEYNGSGISISYYTVTASGNPNNQTTTASSTPTISVGSLTGFGNQTVNTISGEQSYSVSGTALTDNISIAPPAGYEISTGSGVMFVATNPIVLSPSSGTIPPTNIYVRFKPTAITTYSGDISHTSTGATTQNVAVTGTGVAPTDPTGVTATAISNSQINVAFTKNGSNNVLVAWNTTNSFGTPVNENGYSSGNTISGGGTVLYVGGTSPYNHVSLTGNTAYYYKVWTVDASNFYSAGTIANTTTYKDAPATQASLLTFPTVSFTSMTVGWTNGDGDKRIVKINTSNIFTDPTGTDPTANTVYVGGEQVIFNGTANTVSVTGLSTATTYWLCVYEYNNTGTYTRYNISSATDNPKSQITLSASAPIISSPTITGRTSTSATLGGNITNDGGSLITERGTVWSTTTPVTIDNNKLADGNLTTGVFTHSRTSLPVGTLIYYAAYATNSIGTTLTTESSFYTYATQPTTQASLINFSNVAMTSMTVNWTNGNGDYRLVVVKATTTPTTNPSNGVSYSANSQYGLGGTLGANEYILYIGNGNSVDITGLTGSTTYTFKVFEYNGSAGTENYMTTSNATSQVTTGLMYYSTGSVDPTVITNWKSSRDGTGTSPSNFTSGEKFVIQNGHSMTTSVAWSISGTNSKLWIENGGTLTATSAITLVAATIFQIDNGGTYIQNVAIAMSSTIFTGTENFGPSSNFIYNIIPSGSTAPSSPGYGNLTINTTANAGNYGWGGAITQIQGNLLVQSTGTGSFRHAFTAGSAITISIGGNFTISGGNFWLSSGTGTCTVNLSGDLIVNGGTLDVANFSGVGIIYVGGNVSVSSGILTEGGSTTTSKIVFNKNGAQTFTSGGTISNIVNFEVASTSVLDVGTSVISGAGSFTLPSGATLKTSNATGLTGSITTTTKSFSSLANYEFDGASTGTFTTSPTANTVNNLTINNSAGTVTLGQNFTVNGDLSLTSGTMADGGYTLTLAGNLLGTGTHSGTGKITMTGSSRNIPGITLGNLELNNVGGTFTLTGAPTINGNLTLTNGTLADGGYTVTLLGNIAGTGTHSGSGKILMTGSGKTISGVTLGNLELNNAGGFSLSGSPTINGVLTLTSGVFTLGSYTLSLKNPAAGTLSNLTTTSSSSLSILEQSGIFSLPTNITDLNNFTLNSSNGASLNAGLTLSGALTLSNGLLTIGSNNLTLSSTSTIGGTPSASSMVVADGDGKLIKNFTGTGSFTFPVGDNTGTPEYSPATVNFASGTFSSASLGVNLKNTKDVNNTSTTDYLTRYWDFYNTGISAFSCGITLNYLPADVTGTEANLYLGHYEGSTWTGLGAANPSTHIMSGTTTSFSRFTGGQQSAMPVTLSSLTNSVTGRNIKLNWTTTSEINNAGFNIERLGIRQQATGNWEKIGYVNGKGTTNTATNYSYDDRNLQTGKYKYRLKQIDHNGNFEYFSLNGEVEVGVPAKFDLSQNYPNPFNPVTKINFDLPLDSKVNIALYDITGREVKSLVNESRTAGYHTVQFNASDLSSGIYFYRIMTKSSAKDFVMTKKMAVIK